MKASSLSLLIFFGFKKNLFAAEAGMPQLNPEFWASQAFWLILIFTFLYLVISKFFLPKIRNNLEVRNNKIKDDLDEARSLKDVAETKLKEYEALIENAKKEVLKINSESKKKLNSDIFNKKKLVDKEIEEALEKAQKEIIDLKKNSLEDIAKLSENITTTIIQELSGEKLNNSSVKAAITEISKKKLSNYL